MAKYKRNNPRQGKFISIYFEDQILPGTFEHTLFHLIDRDLDLTDFDQRYRNDETGAPAYDPRILLKVILFAYSRGITSNRKIAKACAENVIFMALSNDTRPHFTTIADFVATMDKEIVPLFRNVLFICDNLGLIGKELFAIDGCKLPSNASKQWSGTKADFKKKTAKLESAIGRMLETHRDQDKRGEADVLAKNRQYIKKVQKQISKLREWQNNNDDKPGKSGKPIKSNITDNESAKMKTSRGIIQGYDGITTVDAKHQVIVHAEAFGQGQEPDLLAPMIEGTRKNFQKIGRDGDVFKNAKLAADAGFHSEANMRKVLRKR